MVVAAMVAGGRMCSTSADGVVYTTGPPALGIDASLQAHMIGHPDSILCKNTSRGNVEANSWGSGA